MSGFGGDMIDQAIAWHVRQGELDANGWRGFIAWLEADPRHSAAFDAVALDAALIDARLAELPAVLVHVAANDDTVESYEEVRRGARVRWRWAVGGTAIAAGVAALLMPALLGRPDSTYEVNTRPGERRNMTLADGTLIELSGGSRLRLDHDDARTASLDAGEATFHVRHDPADPFTLHSGALTVRDMGTVFNVARRGARLDVAVAEGSVLFQPDAEARTLQAGDGIVVREDVGSVELAPVAVDAVGGWRSGHLSFAGEPMSSVAATIRRLYGVDLTLSPDLSDRPFTGMIRFSGAPRRDIPHLAALIGANWRHDGNRWVLSSAGTDAR